MCYFLNAVTDKPIEKSLQENYMEQFAIMIDDITSITKNRQAGMYYYQIHRQCSCDFVYSGQNAEELQDLFMRMNREGQLLISYILDTGELDDVGTDVQIAVDRYPKRQVTMDEFLDGFPYTDPGNVSFVIQK